MASSCHIANNLSQLMKLAGEYGLQYPNPGLQ